MVLLMMDPGQGPAGPVDGGVHGSRTGAQQLGDDLARVTVDAVEQGLTLSMPEKVGLGEQPRTVGSVADLFLRSGLRPVVQSGMTGEPCLAGRRASPVTDGLVQQPDEQAADPGGLQLRNCQGTQKGVVRGVFGVVLTGILAAGVCQQPGAVLR